MPFPPQCRAISPKHTVQTERSWGFFSWQLPKIRGPNLDRNIRCIPCVTIRPLKLRPRILGDSHFWPGFAAGMLCVRMASGAKIFSMPMEDFLQLPGAAERPVAVLKQRLQGACGQPRFRHRLLLQDPWLNEPETIMPYTFSDYNLDKVYGPYDLFSKDGRTLDEDADLREPLQLQLVVLHGFCETSGPQAEELVDATKDNETGLLLRCLVHVTVLLLTINVLHDRIHSILAELLGFVYLTSFRASIMNHQQ